MSAHLSIHDVLETAKQKLGGISACLNDSKAFAQAVSEQRTDSPLMDSCDRSVTLNVQGTTEKEALLEIVKQSGASLSVPDGRLSDNPTLHACIVTYASDMTLLDTTVLPFGWSWESPGLQMASLDHAMWFHRPFRADE